jgi:hypothetical protein
MTRRFIDEDMKPGRSNVSVKPLEEFSSLETGDST